MPEPLLDARSIHEHLAEVAGELPAGGAQRTVKRVGGAAMAILGLRDATRDVDSIERLDATLRDAIERVARRHGLAPKWLNDSAAPFRPTGLDPRACAVLLDHPALRVLTAPADQLFLMKPYAARAVDTQDIAAIWPLCSFTSPDDAVEAFYAAYPLEEPDEYLADFVRSIT